MKKNNHRAALVTAITITAILGLLEGIYYVIRYISTGKSFPEEPYFFEKCFRLIDLL
jgi:hypothetical protein